MPYGSIDHASHIYGQIFLDNHSPSCSVGILFFFFLIDLQIYFLFLSPKDLVVESKKKKKNEVSKMKLTGIEF